ncbi:MAG: hypothetical protein AVDCRST_MAG09-1510, partial [uncultured Sphingomonas sp.]
CPPSTTQPRAPGLTAPSRSSVLSYSRRLCCRSSCSRWASSTSNRAAGST